MRSNPRFGKFKKNVTPPALYGICAHAGYDPYLVQAWNDHYQSLHSAYSHSGHPSSARESAPNVVNSDTQTQPAMLTLKQFLDTQDENISDSEVMRKYTEYKTDFKRQQLNEFFVAHKDEEWWVAAGLEYPRKMTTTTRTTTTREEQPHPTQWQALTRSVLNFTFN